MKRPNSQNFTQNLVSYYNHLKLINGVKFTPREIDIIACLLSAKGLKTIALFLSIEEKTIETHKYNIMRKLECNTIELNDKTTKQDIRQYLDQSAKLYSAIYGPSHLFVKDYVLQNLSL